MTPKTNPTTMTLPTDRQIVTTRVFDAPRALVFKAFTEPDAIRQWWGRKGSETIVDQMDVRPGGLWRYVQRDSRGNEHAFKGEFREVVPPERLVQTFEYEPMPGHVLLEAITFEEQDGNTLVTTTSTFQSVEDRDGMLQSGMETGQAESLDQLDEYLKTQV